MKKMMLFVSAVILVSGFVVFDAFGSTRASARNREPVTRLTDEQIYAELKKFAAVFEAARANFVEEVDERKILEAAMNGMLAALDPHSSYLNADDMRDFSDRTSGSFGGLGIQVTADRGVIRVISPIDDTPAARAGIQAGDLITHINGEQVSGLTLSQAVRQMKGRPGTTIRLTIIQDGRAPRTITLTRAIIRVKSVRFETKGENNDVGYIRISDFGARTTRELRDAITALEKKNVKGYIIDVRNNPGGYLTAAVNVADAFLDGGDIVSTRGRGGREMDIARARPGDMANAKPVVVLVNHGSASASEIVAGAIQDNRRGIVMGSRTYGKGSVQQQKPFADGTAIHITVARYFTPSGREIQSEGIIPDVEVLHSRVEVLERRRDIFAESTLIGALENRSNRNRDRNQRAADADEDEGPLSDEERARRDYQLNRAIDMVLALYRLTPPRETTTGN
ncbi:MAG: S41 family peptidase [Alphaproteobacteria bacterium]|nr:S41 family peptidase [Alphaproteobacteria bacterium]MCL2758054.1 S41 family peptidase [Alphaproteobacteria bacterium]